MAISTPSIRKVHVTAPIEEVCKILREDGVVVVEKYAPAEFVDALNAEAYPVFEAVRRKGNPKHVAVGKKEFRPPNTDVIIGLAGKVPNASIKLLQHPVWHGVMEHFLVKETWDWLSDEKRVRKGSYWMQACNGYRVRPGASAQYLHRDSVLTNTQREIGLDKSPMGVGGFVAGTNVTARNGGTNIIPGSHLWPLDRIPRPEEAVAAELNKGDGVFWLSTIFHGAGANVCAPDEPDAERMMYGYFGADDTLRQPDLQILSVPPEVVLKMPEIVLRMVGFIHGGTGSGKLGGYDPIDVWEPVAGKYKPQPAYEWDLSSH